MIRLSIDYAWCPPIAIGEWYRLISMESIGDRYQFLLIDYAYFLVSAVNFRSNYTIGKNEAKARFIVYIFKIVLHLLLP